MAARRPVLRRLKIPVFGGLSISIKVSRLWFRSQPVSLKPFNSIAILAAVRIPVHMEFLVTTGRYRYYVSRELVRGGRSSVGKEKNWRLAAPELEQSVVVSVRRILNDHAAIATTLQEAGVSSAEIDSVLKAAEAKSALLESGSQAAPTIAELVKRVDLRKNGIEISMNLESLLPSNSVTRAPFLTFARFVPLQMKRRGVAMRLVIGGGVSTRKTDPTLLKAVARGHKWFNELVSGRAMFTREIAAREGVNERFVRRLIPLAFLSPAIVQAIAEGRHPEDLTGEGLSRGINIPLDWDKQKAVL
jgi:site-specific DNA recombinase